MIRTLLALSTAALVLTPLAQADRYGSYHDYGYQHSGRTSSNGACERQREDDRMAGRVVGALAGGLLGAAIANNDDDHYRHRNYRGYRGNHGYRRHHRRDDDGDQIAGAVIGGVLGAVVGGEIAAGSADCNTSQRYSSHDPYAPTRSPTGPAWENPERQQSRTVVTRTSEPVRTVTTRRVVTESYPEDDLYGGPDLTRTVPSEPTRVYQRSCTTVQRETRLPDGGLVREPVEVCQDGSGSWQLEDGANY